MVVPAAGAIPIVAHNLMSSVITGRGCTILNSAVHNEVKVVSGKSEKREPRCGLFFGFVWL